MTKETEELTVADIMQTEVATVKPDSTVAELTDLLKDEGISGVPVVGDAGTVVGVVSVSDVSRVVARAASGESPGRRRAAGRPRDGREPGDFFRVADPLPGFLPSELPQSNLGARAVREIMTPATLSVRKTATVAELARFLTRAGVHRALVMEDSRLVGLVSAMDVVRTVAETGEEA